MVLLLHFLVMTSALFGHSASHEPRHRREDLIYLPQLFPDKVIAEHLQKHVVFPLLPLGPVPHLLLFRLLPVYVRFFASLPPFT